MNNWKIVCDKVSTTMDLSEMQFEKTVATLILANLGWNEFRDNIKEQYHIEDHAKGYKPDFALFPKGKTEPGIFVELKETGHKQRAKDVKQIRTYMMLTNCRFCIYFGEKMELFFIKIDGTNRSLKSVLTLDYNPKNPDGNLLLDLINFDTYSEENLIRFCEDRLSADEAISFYTSDEGHKRLFELMAKDRHLSEGAAKLLSSMLTMPERKAQGVEDIVDIEPPSPKPDDKKPATPVIQENVISDFRAFAEKSVGKNTANNYVRHLKGGVSEYFCKFIDQTEEGIFSINSSSELEDCISTLKGNDEFVAANKKLRYFLTASLSKYLEFLESREGGLSSEKTEAKNQVKNTGQENPVHFSMKYGVADAKLDFYPKTKKYVIKADSTIATETKNYCADKVADLRKTVMADSAKSESRGESYILLEDIVLPDSINTPSAAAAFCNGGTADGPKRWKDENGKTHPKEWWK